MRRIASQQAHCRLKNIIFFLKIVPGPSHFPTILAKNNMQQNLAVPSHTRTPLPSHDLRADTELQPPATASCMRECLNTLPWKNQIPNSKSHSQRCFALMPLQKSQSILSKVEPLCTYKVQGEWEVTTVYCEHTLAREPSPLAENSGAIGW